MKCLIGVHGLCFCCGLYKQDKFYGFLNNLIFIESFLIILIVFISNIRNKYYIYKNKINL